jgi:hypothetical protein
MIPASSNMVIQFYAILVFFSVFDSRSYNFLLKTRVSHTKKIHFWYFVVFLRYEIGENYDSFAFAKSVTYSYFISF